jgi:hypothetical protein
VSKLLLFLSIALYTKAAKASTMHKEDTDLTYAYANWGHTLEPGAAAPSYGVGKCAG